MMYLITAPRSLPPETVPILDVEGARFRVVLVSLPDPGARPPWEGSLSLWTLRPEQLPVVVYVSDALSAADDVARRLRGVGAQVTVVAGWSGAEFCGFHGAEYVHARCQVCGVEVCRRCALEAGGHPICPEHLREQTRRRRRLRVRQLFSLFLFSVFLFKIGTYFLQEQRVALDPPVSVGIFQFVPPGMMNHPMIRAMNQAPTRGRRPQGLLAIKDWYDAEYRRFTGSSREYLELKIQGPWSEAMSPPGLAGPDDGPLALTWRSFQYARYWLDRVRERGVEPRDFGARIYVIYGSGGADMASHSRGSERGRMAVVHIDLDEGNPTYAAVTLAHELGHVLGATDKYYPDSAYSVWPEGYVEPYMEPLYPQRYAELMAVDRPLAFDVEAEVYRFDQIRVGHRTAAEMHWISDAQADYFYQQEGADPGDRLAVSEEE